MNPALRTTLIALAVGTVPVIFFVGIYNELWRSHGEASPGLTSWFKSAFGPQAPPWWNESDPKLQALGVLTSGDKVWEQVNLHVTEKLECTAGWEKRLSWFLAWFTIGLLLVSATRRGFTMPTLLLTVLLAGFVCWSLFRPPPLELTIHLHYEVKPAAATARSITPKLEDLLPDVLWGVITHDLGERNDPNPAAAVPFGFQEARDSLSGAEADLILTRSMRDDAYRHARECRAIAAWESWYLSGRALLRVYKATAEPDERARVLERWAQYREVSKLPAELLDRMEAGYVLQER